MVDTFNNEIIGSALSRTAGDPKPYYKCLEDILSLLKDNKKNSSHDSSHGSRSCLPL